MCRTVISPWHTQGEVLYKGRGYIRPTHRDRGYIRPTHRGRGYIRQWRETTVIPHRHYWGLCSVLISSELRCRLTNDMEVKGWTHGSVFKFAEIYAYICINHFHNPELMNKQVLLIVISNQQHFYCTLVRAMKSFYICP